MSDADGRTLLQDVTVCTQIDYINGDRHSRSNTNIPFTTALYYNFTPVNPLPTPFMFNYNALNFDPETRRLSNSSGASWNRTLSMQSAGFSYRGDHLHISRGAAIRYKFTSPQVNPFNRTGQDDLTIIAKVKGENSAYYSIFSCRGSASTSTNYRFQEGGGTDNTQYFSLLDNRSYGYAPGLTVNTLPNIIIVRARNGYIWLESFTDRLSSAMMPVEWGGLSEYVSFFYGGSAGQYWQGDFYWMFLANRALSDSEIQQVINYNGI